MRLVAAEVLNYKGLSRASLEGLGDLPVVMISGRNGTGKSLLLEAIVGAWSGLSGPFSARTGPWASYTTVDLTVSFTEQELEVIDGWHEQSFGSKVPRGCAFRLRQTWHATGGVTVEVQDSVVQIVRQVNFQRLHPFGVIDFLPSTRILNHGGVPTVDLPMLSADGVEQERSAMLDAAIVQRSSMNMPNIANFLATLDYQAMLQEREGSEPSRDYELIAATLKDATGKTLKLPRSSAEHGSVIEIELPEGHTHGLRDLSTGEQEMLALAYFARRLSAAGGILCLDEPEQHLHPTLQAALFEGLRGIADRAQVIVVSHSVNLIVSAPPGCLLHVSAARDMQGNQVAALSDEADRARLIADLGVSPADLLQSDMLVVVEGETDAQWLRAMFPLEFGRAHIIVAGGGKAVLAAHETLSAAPANIPWLCIMDRDLMTDEEVTDLKDGRSNLFVWPRREFESMLLEPGLIASAFSSVGRDTSEEEAESMLRAAAQPLIEDVCEVRVQRELSRRVPSPTSTTGDRFQRMEEHLRRDAEVHTRRADLVATVVPEVRSAVQTEWPDEWRALADPKTVLQIVHAEAKVFRDCPTMIGALVARARDQPQLRAPGLEALRSRVAALLATTPH